MFATYFMFSRLKNIPIIWNFSYEDTMDFLKWFLVMIAALTPPSPGGMKSYLYKYL